MYNTIICILIKYGYMYLYKITMFCFVDTNTHKTLDDTVLISPSGKWNVSLDNIMEINTSSRRKLDFNDITTPKKSDFKLHSAPNTLSQSTIQNTTKLPHYESK